MKTFAFPGKRSSRRGLTLIELVMALALCALIIGSVTVFVFSMGELWGRGGEVRLFSRHVDGVMRFLNYHLERAELFPENLQGESAPGPVFLDWARSNQTFDEPLLTFVLPESPGLFPWPEEPLPEVVCHLRLIPGEGLFIQWHSRLEENFRDQDPRQMELSPYLTSITYWYFETETERWTERPDLERLEREVYRLPNRISLTFTWDGLEQERFLTLPAGGLNALHARRF